MIRAVDIFITVVALIVAAVFIGLGWDWLLNVLAGQP